MNPRTRKNGRGFNYQQMASVLRPELVMQQMRSALLGQECGSWVRDVGQMVSPPVAGHGAEKAAGGEP